MEQVQLGMEKYLLPLLRNASGYVPVNGEVLQFKVSELVSNLNPGQFCQGIFFSASLMNGGDY
jgi:hypothetical protein